MPRKKVVRTRRAIKSKELGKDIKRNPFVAAAIPATIYFIFYSIVSYAFFRRADFLAALFGATIFWIIYLFLQILKGKAREH